MLIWPRSLIDCCGKLRRTVTEALRADVMTGDFRIRTSGGGFRVSDVPQRSEAIFAPPLAIGLVIGTFAAVPYVHLQLEARRRFYPDVPLIVHDDASPNQRDLRRLCADYGCEFESNDTRRPLCIGDVSCLLGGLLWAKHIGLDIVVKMSRRFVPLRDWSVELQELALASQYPTFSNICKTLGYGFRSECVGMAVNEWIRNWAHEQLAMIALAPGTPFVEGALHQIAKYVARFRCRAALRWDETTGPRPDDRDGYAPWAFMGTDRYVAMPAVSLAPGGAAGSLSRASTAVGFAIFPRGLHRPEPRVWHRGGVSVDTTPF
jgi:hypothetical protein